MTVRPRRIGHIGLVSTDLERLVAWYEDVLGFQVSDRMPYPEDAPFYEGVWMRCNSDHHVVSLFGLRVVPERPHDPRALSVPGFHHVAFEMESFEALRRIARYARDNDIPIAGMRTGGPGVQLRVYIWDPDDHMVELFWGLDQIGWDGATRPYPPLETIDLETMDIDEWLAWKGPEFVPGAPEASGHAVARASSTASATSRSAPATSTPPWRTPWRRWACARRCATARPPTCASATSTTRCSTSPPTRTASTTSASWPRARRASPRRARGSPRRACRS